MFIIRLHY